MLEHRLRKADILDLLWLRLNIMLFLVICLDHDQSDGVRSGLDIVTIFSIAFFFTRMAYRFKITPKKMEPTWF